MVATWATAVRPMEEDFCLGLNHTMAQVTSKPICVSAASPVFQEAEVKGGGHPGTRLRAEHAVSLPLSCPWRG